MSKCYYCSHTPSLSISIQGALYEKHCSSASFSYIYPIQAILKDNLSLPSVECREMKYLCDWQEYLKRPYQREQYFGKINQLTEYYKFTRDIPKFHDPGLFTIMEKYGDRMKEIDFRRVKAAVKKEQGISLTSIHSQQSMDSQEQEKKSHYSNVLESLEDDSKSQSHIFKNICFQLQEVLPGKEPQSAIKGYFPEKNCKRFQEFMAKEERKIKKNCFKKQKQTSISQKISSKQNTMKNGLNLIREPSKKSVIKHLCQRTRANDTISREQGQKKGQKHKITKIKDQQHVFKNSLSSFFRKKNPNSIEMIYKSNGNSKVPCENYSKDKIKTRKSNPKIKKEAKASTQNLFVLDTDRRKEQRQRKSLDRRSKSISRRQPSFKVLPKKEGRQPYSRSKSKPMSRQNSRESIRSHSKSNLHQSLSKKEKENQKIDLLLAKKLAIFKL